jgi:hypothetical protein
MFDLLLYRVLFSELPGSMVGVGVILVVTREEVEVLLTLTELLGARVVDVDSTSLPFVGLGEVLRVPLAVSIAVVVLGASSLLAGAKRTAAAIFTHKQRQSKALALEAVGSNMTSGLPMRGISSPQDLDGSVTDQRHYQTRYQPWIRPIAPDWCCMRGKPGPIREEKRRTGKCESLVKLGRNV